MNYREETFDFPNAKLYSRRYDLLHPKAEIILLHGFGEHCGRYDALIERLLESGYAVTTYDQRGHGRSSGLLGHIDNFADYEADLDRAVFAVRGRYEPQKLFLIGHSMGGLVVLRYLMNRGDLVDGAVISAPLVALGAPVPAFKRIVGSVSATLAPRFRMQNGINPALLSRDQTVGEAYAADPLVNSQVSARWFSEAIKAMEELKQNASQITAPLLVMHGTADRLASCAATERLFELIGSDDKRLKIYDGYFHELFNEPEKEEIFERVIAWLDLRAF